MRRSDIFRKAKPARAIFIDLDNTMYAYDPCHIYALKKCHAHYHKAVQRISFEDFQQGYVRARNAVKRHNGSTVGSRSRHLYFQRMLEQRLGKTDVELALHLGNIYWRAFLQKVKLKSWVLPFLHDCRARGIKVVVITNLESSIQYRKLLRLKVAHLIDFIVTSEEAGIEKPNPKIYAIALDKIGIKPEDAVMLGDNVKEDGSGAQRAGIPFVLCG